MSQVVLTKENIYNLRQFFSSELSLQSSSRSHRQLREIHLPFEQVNSLPLQVLLPEEIGPFFQRRVAKNKTNKTQINGNSITRHREDDIVRFKCLFFYSLLQGVFVVNCLVLDCLTSIFYHGHRY